MARTLTTAQDRVWGLTQRAVHARVYVEDADGAWRNLSDLEGHDWVTEVDWGGDIDAPVMDARVLLVRSRRDLVLAPEFAASKLNRKTSDGTYGPLLAPRRNLKIEAAATARGVPPESSDWVEVFTGQIDMIDPAKRGIEVTARDPGGLLQDVWIEDDDRTYGDPAGSPVETEMQAILNHAAASWGAPSVTLYVPTSPSWNILEYNADSGPVLDEIVRLAQQIGWVVRYRWDSGTSAWRLTLFEPDRAATTPDVTFANERVRSVRKASVDLSTIRNVIKVRYTDATVSAEDGDATNGQRSVTRTDATSISNYGRRFMEIAEDAASQIDTSAEATTMADAILSDLKDPVTDTEVSCSLDIRAELHDLVRIEADGITRDSDIDLGVTRIRHYVSKGAASTTIAGRGAAPAGYGQTWRGLGTGPGRARPGSEHAPPALAPGWTSVSLPGGVEVSTPMPNLTPKGRAWQLWELYASASSGITPSASTLKARGQASSFRLEGPPGESEYVLICGVDEAGNRDTSPGNEALVTYGQAGPSFLHPDVNWAGQFMGRSFDVFTRGEADFPPDFWHMVTGSWGSDADSNASVRESGETSLELSLGGVEMASSYMPVRPGVPYRVQIRWQGLATTAGREFIAKVEWHSDKGTAVQTDTIVNALPGAASTWEDATLLQTAPATARWARLTVSLAGTSHSDSVYIDTVEFEQIFERFRAYHGSTQSLGNATWTRMDFTTESYDLGAFYAAPTCTIKAPGIYNISAGATIANADLYAVLAIYLNGSLIAANPRDTSNHEGEIDAPLTITQLGLQLAAGDYLEIYGRGDDSAGTPTAQSGSDGAWFAVERVS